MGGMPQEGCELRNRDTRLPLQKPLCYRPAERWPVTAGRRRAAMAVDAATVRRIAHLARIAVAEEEIGPLQGELNAILAFVERLSEVDVEGVEPMTSVIPMDMKTRADVVTDGGIPDDIVKNAPMTEEHFFVVPKVVE